jgi:hypothetical protein
VVSWPAIIICGFAAFGKSTDLTGLMSAAKFHLTTDWSFAAPRAAVWQALCAVEDWPAW